MQHLSALASLAAGTLLLLAGCASDTPDSPSGATGTISARVKADPAVHDAVPRLRSDQAARVPSPSDFALTLAKADGSYSDTWQKLSDFPTNRGFAVGAYTLEASYGSLDTEGFDAPYFYGVSDIHVVEGGNTEAEVTARLANTMVSLEYTEAFRNFFKEYSGQLHSAGGDFITMTSADVRPVYLRPGQVTLTISIVKQNGLSANIEAASFEALPQHHYHLSLDVNNGETGEGALTVRFDDSVVAEDIEIDLSDSFLLAPAPEVKTKGFVSGETLRLAEGERPAEASFVASVPGGISGAVLTTQSQELSAKGFPSEIDLVRATPEQRQLLASMGLEVIGLWHNPDKMAVVNLAGLLASLSSSDEHSFALVFKDRLGKVNIPSTLNVETSSVTLDITSLPDIYIDQTRASLTVDYSGDDFAGKVSVELQNASGSWVPVNAVAASGTRSGSYTLGFDVPDAHRDFPVRVLYQGKVKDTAVLHKRGVILSADPADVYATYATLSMEKNIDTPASDISVFYDSGNGTFVKAGDVTFDASGTRLAVRGLPAGTTLKFKASDTGSLDGAYKEVLFTTEAAAQVQNSKMDAWSHDSGWEKKVPVVGYKETIYQYFPNSSAVPNEYWATRNAMTTCPDFGYTSMFYNHYSGTYGVDGGVTGKAAEICTVGWAKSKANTFLPSGNGVCNQRSAGMLFMGSYRYDKAADNEVFDYGRPFTSRPTALTFQYKYAPVDGESFRAYVVVENRSGGKVTEIGRGELTSATAKSSFTKAVVSIDYKNRALKATHAYVVFVSSTADNPGYRAVEGSKGAFSGFADARYIGSVLTVDDIICTY